MEEPFKSVWPPSGEYMQYCHQDGETIQLDGETLTKCQSFRYLGSRVSADGGLNTEIAGRINATWRKRRECSGILCDKRMPTYLKSIIYRTVVRPVALYSTETWPTTKHQEHALHTMEMRMLRWSLGVSRLDHIPNTIVRERYGVAPITDKMREWRLRWFGHVIRQETGVAKTAYIMKILGKQRRGAPKTRWTHRVNKDLKALELHEDDALERKIWRNKTKCADPALRD